MERRRTGERFLELIARAVFEDGVVDDDERALLQRALGALNLSAEEVRPLLSRVREAAPKKGGKASTEALWREASEQIAAMPPGAERHALARRVGWILKIDDARTLALAGPVSERDVVQSTARGLSACGMVALARGEGDDARRAVELLAELARRFPDEVAERELAELVNAILESAIQCGLIAPPSIEP
jgi:hypothetical protein